MFAFSLIANFFMANRFLFLVLVLFEVVACSVSQNTAGVWVNKEKFEGKKYTKIFIVVLTENIEARRKVESELSFAAQKRGINTIKSIDELPPMLSDVQGPSNQKIKEAVGKNNCDGVFEVTLLRKEEEVHYVPGIVSYRPSLYWHWNGNMWHYYNRWYPVVMTPGYYNREREYFIQSNFYDVASEELMLSVQSDIYNPSSLSSFAKLYVKDVVRQLELEGLLKK